MLSRFAKSPDLRQLPLHHKATENLVIEPTSTQLATRKDSLGKGIKLDNLG
ncbi:hypothetical protein [Chryseobacterium sp. Leaf394]|uniref:hypothetical protein n=1 Tax=Chryseobacterium sp. Leaf394 TaxID=1736361 RepID=UPI000AE46766|nr:hypothetical protein [Chryseobacterium sp. Leaf394]